MNAKLVSKHSEGIYYFIIEFNMENAHFRKTAISIIQNEAKSLKHHKFLYSKSEPAQFLPRNTLRDKVQTFHHAVTETGKPRKSHSFHSTKDRKNQRSEANIDDQRGNSPTQLQLLNKAIIHDTFSNFLSANYKTFRIGLNTVAIKKKFRFQKSGIGQLACNMAKSKPMSLKERTEPQSQLKRTLRQINQRDQLRLRKRSKELNEWSRRLQFLEHNENNRANINTKTQQLPALSNNKRLNPAAESYKPWSNFDQSASKKQYPGLIRSAYGLYDILQ